MKPPVRRSWLTVPLLLFASTSAFAHSGDLDPSGTFSVYNAGAAPTPPMGWNPWNAFRTEVDEQKILDNASLIVRSGLADAGYRYINIDDGWYLKRGADGRVVIRTSIFPSAAAGPDGETSFRPFTDRMHAMGLKAGIYTDAGRNNCAQHYDLHSPNLPEGSVLEREVGLYGFEARDLTRYFQDWGFDYVKVDACGLANYGPDDKLVRGGQYRALKPTIIPRRAELSDLDGTETLYARIGRILKDINPDGDYVFSICAWGEANVRGWGGRHGNTWRTSPDIEPKWESMLRNVDSSATRELYAGPGRWNDPDMLAIGLGEFDAAHLVEAQTHFSLWSIMAAPLLMGFDLNKAPQEILDILLNKEVIAVNQDRAGNQGVIAYDDGQVQIFVKTLSGTGEKAVALFNRGDNKAQARLTWQHMKFEPGTNAAVRDLWAHRNLPRATDGITIPLRPRETVMLKLVGKPIAGKGYFLSEMPGRVNVAVDGIAEVNDDITKASGAPRADFTPFGKRISVGGRLRHYGIGAQVNSRIEVLSEKEFARFTAEVGVDDSTQRPGDKVVFRVYGDRKLLFESSSLGPGDAPVPVDVDIAGVQIVELVADGGDPAGPPSVVAWANAMMHPGGCEIGCQAAQNSDSTAASGDVSRLKPAWRLR
jgi:hypothetical protein